MRQVDYSGCHSRKLSEEISNNIKCYQLSPLPAIYMNIKKKQRIKVNITIFAKPIKCANITKQL